MQMLAAFIFYATHYIEKKQIFDNYHFVEKLFVHVHSEKVETACDWLLHCPV